MKSKNFLFVDEHNLGEFQKIPVASNFINYSKLYKLDKELVFRSFSIKYVHKGIERYYVNGHYMDVSEGSYLLASQFSTGAVLIQSQEPTEGVCIDISPSLICQTLQSHHHPGTLDPVADTRDFLLSDLFLDHVYPVRSSSLGRKLPGLAQFLNQNKDSEISEDLFYELCECLIEDQKQVFGQFNSIDAIKTSTKKEVLRRLLIAREFMDTNYSKSLSCCDMAQQAALSEYHFFRLFKRVFNISPRQYIIRKRLEVAQGLIRDGEDQVTDIAVSVGFSDLQSFSKSFRKMYGYPPSEVRLSKKQHFTSQVQPAPLFSNL